MMKNNLISISLLLVCALSAAAQDSLYVSPLPKEEYYCKEFPEEDTVKYDESWSSTEVDITAKILYISDTLTVYGIAAVIVDPNFRWRRQGWEPDPADLISLYADTSYSGCIESLRLYRFDTNTANTLTQVGEDLTIHLIDTPLSYYWDIQKVSGMMRDEGEILPPLPVYERYFSSPHTVADSFCIAFTFFSYYFAPNGLRSRYGMGPFTMTPHTPKFPPWLEPTADYWNSQWYFWRRGYTHCKLYFPILKPNPAGGGGGGDSLAAGQADMLQRMVSVSPNPANGRARVLSSFGLTRIEAFAPDGRPMLDRQAGGLTADLDLAGWPVGTYLLRIHTPVGTATRKLVVSR